MENGEVKSQLQSKEVELGQLHESKVKSEESTMEKMKQFENAISEKQTELAKQISEIEQLKSESEAQKSQLEDKITQIAEQKSQLEEQTTMLHNQQNTIEQLNVQIERLAEEHKTEAAAQRKIMEDTKASLEVQMVQSQKATQDVMEQKVSS